MAIDYRTEASIVPYQRALPHYLDRELAAVQASIEALNELAPQVADRAPTAPRKGTVRVAVDPWDPLSTAAWPQVVYWTGAAWARLAPNEDADTLEGHAAAYFATADHAHTVKWCRVNRTTGGAFTVADATGTVVEWTDEEADVGGWADLTANSTRLTVPAGVGLVRVGFQGRWGSDNVGVRRHYLLKNGGSMDGRPRVDTGASNTNDTYQFWSGPVPVEEDDYFEVEVYQNSGGNLNLIDASTYNWFSIEALQ